MIITKQNLTESGIKSLTFNANIMRDADGNQIADIMDQAFKTQAAPNDGFQLIDGKRKTDAEFFVQNDGWFVRVEYAYKTDGTKVINKADLMFSILDSDLLSLAKSDPKAASGAIYVFEVAKFSDSVTAQISAQANASAPAPVSNLSATPVTRTPAPLEPAIPVRTALVDPVVQPPVLMNSLFAPETTRNVYPGTSTATLTLPEGVTVTGVTGYDLDWEYTQNSDGTLTITLKRPLSSSAKGDMLFDLHLTDGSSVPIKFVVVTSKGSSSSVSGNSKFTKEQMDKMIAANAGLLGSLRDDSTLDAALGTTGLNANITNGIGGLIGTKGTQMGSGGLGGRGGGLGGGGTADGLGGLGSKGYGSGSSGYGSGEGSFGVKREGGIAAFGGDAIILGALDKAQIDAVIKQHMSYIRYYYERELKKEPTLGGKITVKFIIAKDGSVSSATTKASTMNNPTVEAAINARFLKMQFPAPKGGGIAIVSYPFVFSPSY